MDNNNNNYSSIHNKKEGTNQKSIIILRATKCKDIFEELESDNLEDEESIQLILTEPDYHQQMEKITSEIYKYQSKIDEFIEYPFFKLQNTCKFIPTLIDQSQIINEKQLREIHANLPYYQQYKNMKLLYSISVHGTFMRTFYEKTSIVDNCIMIIKDNHGNIFGAYSSERFKIKYNQFYGTAETFIFSFYKGNKMHCFPSSHLNENFIYSDDQRIAFGCSDKAFSLSLENDFLQGYTNYTKTFNNIPLSNEKFIVLHLEVWQFQ